MQLKALGHCCLQGPVTKTFRQLFPLPLPRACTPNITSVTSCCLSLSLGWLFFPSLSLALLGPLPAINHYPTSYLSRLPCHCQLCGLGLSSAHYLSPFNPQNLEWWHPGISWLRGRHQPTDSRLFSVSSQNRQRVSSCHFLIIRTLIPLRGLPSGPLITSQSPTS